MSFLLSSQVNDLPHLKPRKKTEEKEQEQEKYEEQSYYKEEEEVWDRIEIDLNNINVGFDYISVLECFCECDVSPEVDISNFDPSMVKSCPEECCSWLLNVTNELKKISKENNLGTTLWEVLQGCSQENINKWVNSHPTYTKITL